MDVKAFDLIVESRIEKIREVLAAKGGEYGVGDRLHNFKVAANILGCTPELALIGMKVKHDVSVLDLVRNPSMRSLALINEKIGDSINYNILLEALLLEAQAIGGKLK